MLVTEWGWGIWLAFLLLGLLVFVYFSVSPSSIPPPSSECGICCCKVWELLVAPALALSPLCLLLVSSQPIFWSWERIVFPPLVWSFPFCFHNNPYFTYFIQINWHNIERWITFHRKQHHSEFPCNPCSSSGEKKSWRKTSHLSVPGNYRLLHELMSSTAGGKVAILSPAAKDNLFLEELRSKIHVRNFRKLI